MPRRIVHYPHPALRHKSKPVMSIDKELHLQIGEMKELMYLAKGLGLAAPQVGLSLRLFVVDVTSGRDANALMTFINPEIIKAEGRIQEDEGCLSLPGVYGPTPRATQVVLRGMNRQGEIVEVEGEGLLARAFQHEMDHLQGMLFFNRMGPAARDIVIRKFKRAQRQRH